MKYLILFLLFFSSCDLSQIDRFFESIERKSCEAIYEIDRCIREVDEILQIKDCIYILKSNPLGVLKIQFEKINVDELMSNTTEKCQSETNVVACAKKSATDSLKDLTTCTGFSQETNGGR